MSDARTEVLARIRAALGADRGAGFDVGFERAGCDALPDAVRTGSYERGGTLSPQAVLDLFEQRVSEYRATVRRVSEATVATVAGEVCRDLGVQQLATPAEVPAGWRPAGVRIIEDHGLKARELDAVDGALTGCAVAIARSGTIVLDGQGLSGRRLLTLVPDTHICVVYARQVTETLPQALERVGEAVRMHHAPITLISGPSATSDIELARVEGVHGPRNLVVLLVVHEDGGLDQV
ncbi:MAG: LutC/YkgG family protein [Solirubrobacteraceae bacterium]